jgi:peptidyl-prolyl cis-trans isomerase B (cyclophilin B)
MRKLVPIVLSVFLVFAACKSQEKPANQVPAQNQTQAQPVQKEAPKGPLQKYPADYPITGDSVAVMAVSIAGQPAGEMVIEFYPGKAPNHVRNFKWLADHSFYNGVSFHRIIKGFMAQGGDPAGNGQGGPGWTTDAEFNDTPHGKGILSMARTSEPNSAGSQFFLCDDMAPPQQNALNGKYTVFGKVVKGIDVLDKVLNVSVGGPQGSSPQVPVVMTTVKIVARSEALPK